TTAARPGPRVHPRRPAAAPSSSSTTTPVRSRCRAGTGAPAEARAPAGRRTSPDRRPRWCPVRGARPASLRVSVDESAWWNRLPLAKFLVIRVAAVDARGERSPGVVVAEHRQRRLDLLATRAHDDDPDEHGQHPGDTQ